MKLTPIQGEVIDAAHHEGEVDPATFARLLSHHPDDVDTAISDLVDRELMAAEGDTFHLTEQGEGVYRRRQEAERAAVGRRVHTWQRR